MHLEYCIKLILGEQIRDYSRRKQVVHVHQEPLVNNLRTKDCKETQIKVFEACSNTMGATAHGQVDQYSCTRLKALLWWYEYGTTAIYIAK